MRAIEEVEDLEMTVQASKLDRTEATNISEPDCPVPLQIRYLAIFAQY